MRPDAVLGLLIDPASAKRAHEVGERHAARFTLGEISGVRRPRAARRRVHRRAARRRPLHLHRADVPRLPDGPRPDGAAAPRQRARRARVGQVPGGRPGDVPARRHRAARASACSRSRARCISAPTSSRSRARCSSSPRPGRRRPIRRCSRGSGCARACGCGRSVPRSRRRGLTRCRGATSSRSSSTRPTRSRRSRRRSHRSAMARGRRTDATPPSASAAPTRRSPRTSTSRARERAEVVTPVAAESWPSNKASRATFETLVRPIEDAVRAGCDAVFLDLHGAMVIDDCDDPEGEIARRVRAHRAADADRRDARLPHQPRRASWSTTRP